MEVKENRPDACAASGTANSIYKDFSTDAPDIQEELTGPVLPDECAADIVSFCSEQTIAYDDLLEYATLFYLQDKDPEDPPFRDTLKFELLTLTNRCIDAYNFGKRDPNAAPGAKLKDAYPDKKEGAERYEYTRTYPVTLIYTDAGWRFDAFTTPNQADMQLIGEWDGVEETDFYNARTSLSAAELPVSK